MITKEYIRKHPHASRIANIKAGDIGQVIHRNNGKILMYNKEWDGHCGYLDLDGSNYQGHCWDFTEDRYLEKIEYDNAIFIARCGNKVIAEQGEELGISTCSPEDEFDFETGVKLAVERLFEKKKQKKITLKEFFNSKYDLAIHCNTEEKANALLKAFDKFGASWGNGDYYLEKNEWNRYKDKTIYTNKGAYANIGGRAHIINRYEIYEFEEVDLGEQND